MNKEIMVLNIEMVSRQRNVFLILSIATIFCCLLLALKLVTTKERIVLVPGLNQEVWTTENEVSASYLSEVSSMYIPFLLDLDSGCIDWKRERLFKHVSQSDVRYMKELAQYFASAKKKYAKFSLSTHFAVKKFEVNEKTLTVEAHGQLTSRFGEKGVTSNPAVYRLNFEWVSGKLLLKEFVHLIKNQKGEYESETIDLEVSSDYENDDVGTQTDEKVDDYDN